MPGKNGPSREDLPRRACGGEEAWNKGKAGGQTVLLSLVGLVVALLTVGSAIGLVGIVFVPEFTYPFLWISPFMVVVLLKMLFRSPCALDDVAMGNWSRIVRFAVASLICGLVWESNVSSSPTLG